MQKFMAV